MDDTVTVRVDWTVLVGFGSCRLGGFKPHVKPVQDAERPVVPVQPPRLDRVMIEVACPPCATVSVFGLATSAKP
jgi:hypothetical protein